MSASSMKTPEEGAERAALLSRLERFANACAICGQVGREVAKSLEGKGFHYCVDGDACRSYAKAREGSRRD